MSPENTPLFSPRDLDAVIFDLDGVITDTAVTHRAAWKEVFDEFLRRRLGEGFQPFTKQDYQRWVDGMPRFDGVRSFLDARGLELSEGGEEDGPGFDTVYGLGMEKNRRYRRRLEQGEIEVLDGAVECLHRLRDQGIELGLVSSSRNAKTVLELVGLDKLFSTRVDGVTLEEEDLEGKPDPAMFLEAARRLGVPPRRAAAVEDAVSGIRAAKAGGFSLVVGIAAGNRRRRELSEHGADVVVAGLDGCAG